MFLMITMVLLILATFLSVIRLIIGPTVWDRLLSLNLISAKTIMLIAIYGVYTDNVHLLDIAFSYGIIGFLTIALLTKFVVIGGREK